MKNQNIINNLDTELEGSETAQELVKEMIDLWILAKVLHWNTKSYALHKALDETQGSLLSIIDQVAETYVPKEGMMNLASGTVDDIVSKIDIFAKEMKSYKPNQYPDLVNLADELSAVGSHLEYLSKLK